MARRPLDDLPETEEGIQEYIHDLFVRCVGSIDGEFGVPQLRAVLRSVTEKSV